MQRDYRGREAEVPQNTSEETCGEGNLCIHLPCSSSLKAYLLLCGPEHVRGRGLVNSADLELLQKHVRLRHARTKHLFVQITADVPFHRD